MTLREIEIKKINFVLLQLGRDAYKYALFPILVFIPKFYTGEMGVPLALAANIILEVIFDVFTDPIVGYINDRTNTKWGRRRPWIAMATPLLMVSIYMLFIPPEKLGSSSFFMDVSSFNSNNHAHYTLLCLGCRVIAGL